MMDEVEWAKLTAPVIRGIAARAAATVLLPVGSLEQHGPHLPTITDTRTASEIAIRAARLCGDEPRCLVLPGMWTGLSEHHLPFGGTISLNYVEFAGVLRGVARSLRAAGVGRLLVVNGHGGNVDPLAVACRELAVEFGFPIVATTPWYIPGLKLGEIIETAETAQHACEAETSVMLAMMPAEVRRERLDEAVQQAPAAIHTPPGFSRFRSFSERAPVTGTIGDPRPASAPKGERILDRLAEGVVRAIRDEVLWQVPDAVWAPGRGQRTTAGRG